VSCGEPSKTSETPPIVTDATETTIADTTTTATETTPPATTTPTTEAPTTTVAPTPLTAPYWAVPAGMEVAVAGSDGLHLLTGNDDRIISPGAYTDVAADPAGDGWFVELPEAIHHISDDGTDVVAVTAAAGTWLQLHDVGMVDGHVTVFYNINRPHDGATDASLDEVYASDLVAGKAYKIADAGGWEAGVNLRFGGGALVGLLEGEAHTVPWSYDLTGREGVIDMQPAGLATDYYDDPAGPQALTISPDGTRLSWTQWNVTDEGSYESQQLVIATTDGASRQELTLPAGPARAGFLADHGAYVVASSEQSGDVSATPGVLIDAETGGILVLPVAGPAAATGTWTESPRWAIPGPVTNDYTEQIRALEPQWAGPQSNGNYAEAVAELLLGQETGTDECASTARTFPSTSLGDGPFYIELRTFCDDSIAGDWYEVTIVGPQPDGSLTGGASRRILCWRGVTPDGLCV
jgi:hypothetical protein